jgi:hypothetical protein
MSNKITLNVGLIFLLTNLILGVNAQNDTTLKKLTNYELKNNHVFIECAGNTLFYLIGYEKNFNLKNQRISAILGGAHIPANKLHSTFNYFSLGTIMHFRKEYVNQKARSKKKIKRTDKVGFYETGLFYVKQSPDLKESRPWINVYFGYNLYPKERSWFFRFGALINVLRPGIDREIKELPVSPIPIPRFVIGYSL